jgi:hypothetical protein
VQRLWTSTTLSGLLAVILCVVILVWPGASGWWCAMSSEASADELTTLLNDYGVEFATAFKAAQALVREYKITKRKGYKRKPFGGSIWPTG